MSQKAGSDDTHQVALENLQTAGTDVVFEVQAGMINQAIQTIGMGKYQWHLFVMAGFGWLIDQVRPRKTLCSKPTPNWCISSGLRPSPTP